jgi:hypothetical protein
MPDPVVVLVAYRPAHIDRRYLEDCKESAMEIFSTAIVPGGVDPIGYVATHWANKENREDAVVWECSILIDGKPVDTDRMDRISEGPFSPEQCAVAKRLLDAYNEAFVAINKARVERRFALGRAQDETAIKAEKEMLRRLAAKYPDEIRRST